MPKLLSGFIAKQLGKHLGPHVKAATLIRLTNTARTPGDPSSGLNPTETAYPCRGWIEVYEARLIDGTSIRQDDRRISLLGATISGGITPRQGDRVTIEGSTYKVIGVPKRDPDGAVYELQGRK